MQKVSLAFDPEQQASNMATKTHEFEKYYSKRNNTSDHFSPPYIVWGCVWVRSELEEWKAR